MTKHRIKITVMVLSSLMLLSGCASSENALDSSTKKEQTFVSLTDQIRQLPETDDYKVALDRFGNISSPSDVNAQVMVGAKTVAGYVDSAVLDPYFIARWWELEDDFSEKGLKKVKDQSTQEYMSVLKDTLDSGNMETLSNHIIIPPDREMFSTPEECFSEWKEGSCLDDSSLQESITFLEEDSGDLKLRYEASFNMRLVSDTGGTALQPVSFKADFHLKNTAKDKISYKVQSLENNSITFSESSVETF